MEKPHAVTIIKRSLEIGSGAERFELQPSSEARVREALIRASASDDARAEMEGVLRLLVALETRLRSPAAAERLRSWMRATPEIHDVIRGLGFAGTKSIDLARAFKRREGRSLDLAAPKLDALVPDDSIPLRRLLDARSRRRDPR